MSVPTRCATCGGPDILAVGVCVACNPGGAARSLIFIEPSDDVRGETTEALGIFLGSSNLQLAEVVAGRQPLLEVPSAYANRAVAQLGIPASAILKDKWYRKLPNGFVVMLVAIVAVGAVASRVGVPLRWQSVLLAGGLLVMAAFQLRRSVHNFGTSTALLPGVVRAALAEALVEVEAGPVREQLLDIARVSEQAYGTLDPAFRGAALGHAITELAAAAGPLAVQAARIERVLNDLPQQGAGADTGAQLREAYDAHRGMLQSSLELMGDIARQTVESPESAATTVHTLLQQVRSERRWQHEAYDALG